MWVYDDEVARVLEILEAAFPDVVQKIEDDKRVASEALENRENELRVMGLSAHTLNRFLYDGKSKDEYIAMSDEELLKIRNFGPVALAEFRQKTANKA
jgi:DNA-directed RNA polymerase alpha subunit